MVERRARVDVRVLAKFTSRLQVDDTSPLSFDFLNALVKCRQPPPELFTLHTLAVCGHFYAASQLVRIAKYVADELQDPVFKYVRPDLRIVAALDQLSTMRVCPFPPDAVARGLVRGGCFLGAIPRRERDPAGCKAGCGRQLEPPKSGGRSRNFICSPRLVRRGI